MIFKVYLSLEDITFLETLSSYILKLDINLQIGFIFMELI